VVEEGTIDVGSFTDLFSEVVPHSARGRTRGRYELALDDKGNTRVNATLSGVDDNNVLRFSFRPPALASAPGEAAFAKFSVRPKHTFLRGTARTHQFKVVAEVDGTPPLSATGTYIQDPRIPRWLPRALLALLALVLLLGVLWYTLLRPKIRSEARKAVQTDIAQQVAAGVAGAATQLKTGAPPPIASTTTTTTAAAKPPNSSSVGLPPGPVVDGRLVLTSPGTATFTPPAGKSYQLTDIVLENPHGDTGTLTVLRSGTTLMVLALDNFRDLDYHFVSPIVFPSGTKLQLNAACSSPDCTPGMYFDGYVLAAPPGS
jgi:hypothetical protein